MANIRTCNKHNMIACVEKTAHNADFYQIIDYLTGCSINYSLLVDPDLIGPWLQQFWATASLRVINEVPHIRATVAGKKVLISEETIRADLLFDDADGVDCFPKQVIWDSLRDIGYEGNLAQLTFSKPLFSPQWKYLVHVLLHCLSPKSTSWEQFGTNIASALVGLATNQKFNFSLMIMNGMLGHISNGTPFLMYPRFIQLFLNKQLEGVTRPQNFLPSVTLPSKVFTFMRKHSPKFSCRITPLTPPMLEVVTALAAEEAHSTSSHSRAETSPRDAQGTPTQSAAQASISTAEGTVDLQDTAEAQGTDDAQDASQTSGGDEVLLDLYALNREVRRLKKQTLSQAKQIYKLKAKLKKLSKFSLTSHCLSEWSKHHAFWVESQNLKKEERSKGRSKERFTEDQFFEDIVDKDVLQSWYSRTLDFDDEAGPSSPVRPTQEEGSLKTVQVVSSCDYLSNINKGKGILLKSQKEKFNSFNKSEYERLQMMRKLLEDSSEWDAVRKKEKVGRIEESKAKDYFEETYFSCSRKESNDELLKRSRIQELQKSRDRKAVVVAGKRCKETLRKRKSIPISEEQTIKEALSDLTTCWGTPETSDDDFWKNQEDWEIIRWRLNESSGVHTLELEDGTMIHMLAEKRYPLSRELMIRMLDHGMEVEDENEIAITLIHLFILWTTKDGDDS
ncbi:hypothetical protein Tco_1210224 [Tanacetum coccineum]